MTTETEATEQLRKNLASGANKNWTPDDYDLLIKELASDHARPDETEAQAYTRMITHHPAGQLLYKAYREAALGARSRPRRRARRARTIKKQADLDGENHAYLHSAAVQLQREKPGLSYERAFSRIYTDPKNAKRVAGAKQEHLSRAIRSAWGGTASQQGDKAYDARNPPVGREAGGMSQR